MRLRPGQQLYLVRRNHHRLLAPQRQHQRLPELRARVRVDGGEDVVADQAGAQHGDGGARGCRARGCGVEGQV